MTPVQKLLQFIGTKELSPLADYIRKEILPLEEKMLGEAFEAGERRGIWIYSSDDQTPPDKETYISSIINPKP